MLRRSLFIAALTLVAAAPANAGPPWISIEYPANPHHASTRGALLLVRAYHHSTALATPLTGTAEGLVEGKRRSLPLELRRTNIPGVFALRTTPPRGGTWVLAIRLDQGEQSGASALVTLDERGAIAAVEVPSAENREGWVVPRPHTAADVERALRAAAVAQGGTAGAGARHAGMVALPLLLAFAALRRARRRGA